MTLKSEELFEEAETLRDAVGFLAADVAPAKAPLPSTLVFFMGSGAGFFLPNALDAPSNAAFWTLYSVLPSGFPAVRPGSPEGGGWNIKPCVQRRRPSRR